ncbi:MAG: mechanosensitive ion channel family protein [Kofleriaceae bacterium]
MWDWLDYSWLGLPAWKYLALVGLLLSAFIVKAILEFALRRYFSVLLARAGIDYLTKTINGADRALGMVTFALVIYMGLPLIELAPGAEAIARVAARALAAIAGVWLAFRVLDVLFDYLAGKAAETTSKLDDQLVPMLRRTTKIVTAVIGGLFVLQNLDVDIASLLAGLGLGGLAFALAARDTVANFFGSIMIFVDKPFTIGDWIRIGDHEGVVEEVGFRTSRVRTFYDSILTVPNAITTTAVIDNYGARRYRRYTTTLGLTYDTPPEQVQAFCEGVRAVLARHPGVRKDYYMVEFRDLGAHALEVLLYAFIKAGTWTAELRTRTEVNLEILRLAEQLGVRFAFPTQTLHVESVAQATEPFVTPPVPPADQLAGVIRSFGPRGSAARDHGLRLSTGYDAGAGDGAAGE